MPQAARRLRGPVLVLTTTAGLAVVVVCLLLGSVVGALVSLLLTAVLAGLVLLPGRVVPVVVRRVRAALKTSTVEQDARWEPGHGQTRRLVAELADATREGTTSTRARLDRLEEAVASVQESLSGQEDAAQQAQQRSFAIHANGVDTWSLLRLRDVLPASAWLPAPGRARGWAATPETVLALVEDVLSRPSGPVVLECGSGTSTVWLAAALRHRGDGHVTALEHSPRFAEETERALARADVLAWCDVVTAPLEDVDLEDHGTPWFRPSALERLPRPVDVLFVDGPPGGTGPSARYPALPLLLPLLADGATVVLDDTDRAQERRIVARWQESLAPGRLTTELVTDRATFMRYTGTPGPPPT